MKKMMMLLIPGLATSSLFAQSTMKAVVVHHFGGPEVLTYEDAPRPQPKENEILVRVIAAGVNPADIYVRSLTASFFFHDEHQMVSTFSHICKMRCWVIDWIVIA